MPMPPPKPSTERHDRRTAHEMQQLLRALRANGPLAPERLGELVGAPYWDPGRFDRAVALAVSEGRIIRTSDGHLTTV